VSSARQIRNITLLIGIPAFLVFALLAVFVIRPSRTQAPTPVAPRGTFETARGRVGEFLDAAAKRQWDLARQYLAADRRSRMGDAGLGEVLSDYPAILSGGESFTPTAQSLTWDPPSLQGTIGPKAGKRSECSFVLRWTHEKWWIWDIELNGGKILAD
jgi:hypothetical protein